MTNICDNCLKKHTCKYFPADHIQQKYGCTSKTTVKSIGVKVGRICKSIAIVCGVAGILFGALAIHYSWTKTALEDLTGREPSWPTVLWAMTKGNNK